MKALSKDQASKCENAVHPRCNCRCGGEFHGAGRVLRPEARAGFEQLPADDPHHLPNAEERKQRSRENRRARRAKRPATQQLGLSL